MSVTVVAVIFAVCLIALAINFAVSDRRLRRRQTERHAAASRALDTVIHDDLVRAHARDVDRRFLARTSPPSTFVVDHAPLPPVFFDSGRHVDASPSPPLSISTDYGSGSCSYDSGSSSSSSCDSSSSSCSSD